MSVRAAFALLLAGTAAFTVYGSLVPFESRSRGWDDATDAFVATMRDRWLFVSRSDALANVLLGVPLGFALLGLLFAERPPQRAKEAAFGLLLLPGCGLFAAAIEFAQLWFPLRTCAGSDVLCQMFGAALGMAAWLVAGRTVAAFIRDFWSGAGTAQRTTFAYFALLAFIQVLPLDLNASPRTAAKKALREVNTVPLGELIDAPHGQRWGPIAKAATVYGLFVPLGVLMAQWPSRRWHRTPQLIALAGGLAAGLEAIQLPIESRMPSATDAVVGAAGILSGLVFGSMQRPGFPGGTASGFVPWWLILLATIWGPLPFPPTIRTPPAPFEWMPGLSMEGGHPLFALEDMLTKLVVFGLGGAVIGALDVELKARTRCGIAGGVGLAVAAGIEAMQTVFGAHTPSITDVLLGGTGAALGAVIAFRCRM